MIQNDRKFPYIPPVLGIYVVKDSWNPSNPSKYEEFHGFEIVPLSYAKSTVSINEFDNFDLLCISLPRVSHCFAPTWVQLRHQLPQMTQSQEALCLGSTAILQW